MASRLHAETIRLQVRQILEQHGAAPGSEICESLLIRSGFFCGRRFEMDGLSAVWFVEEGELKIYDRDGKTLCAEDAAVLEPRKAA